MERAARSKGNTVGYLGRGQKYVNMNSGAVLLAGRSADPSMQWYKYEVQADLHAPADLL